MLHEKKLYVLVRKDLSRSQQAVQAGHAVAEYLKQHPNTEWQNGTLVYLVVYNERHLADMAKQLLGEGYAAKDIVGFHEPDRDNEMTAFAVLGNGTPMFQDLPLM